MKVYHNQQEVEGDIKDGVLTIEGDVKFECSISIEASIRVSGDINAWNITAWNITAGDITAGDINAWNITAWNITAWNITAWNITAWDILYHAFCCIYKSIKCLSIKASRGIHKEPICLEGTIEIKKPETKNPKEIKVNNATYRLVED